MHDSAEGRAVRCSLGVVLYVLRYRFFIEWVTQTGKEFLQLFARKEVEEHQDIDLLGYLVIVRRITFGGEYPRKILDILVLLPVRLPVKLLQLLVPLELADYSIILDGNEHLPADFFPSTDFVLLQLELLQEPVARRHRHASENFERLPEHPHGHDVCVRVIFYPHFIRVRIRVVVFVRAHYSPYFVATR